jgi:hypothetical protein
MHWNIRENCIIVFEICKIKKASRHRLSSLIRNLTNVGEEFKVRLKERQGWNMIGMLPYISIG